MATKIDQTEAASGSETWLGLAQQFAPQMDLAELGRLYRRAARLAGTGPMPKLSARVAVLSNYSTQFLQQGLELALGARGIKGEVFGAPFNQWQTELLDPRSATSEFRPDIVLLTLSSALLAYREAAGDPRAFATHLAELVRQGRQRLGARFLVTLPEPLQEELETTCWAAEWRAALNRALTEALGQEVLFLDLAPFVTAVGADNWYAGRYLVSGKFAANPERTAALADYIAAHLVGLVRRAIRLVIVDLDNTLWGGVVGEVGWENVDLDVDGKGYAYLRLQRFLLGLYDKGVVLAVSSKNNPDDVREVFTGRPEMILKEQHFTEMRINWRRKSQNVGDILETLNLTETGTAFIDDSAFERGEIRCMFPEAFVPEFPTDPVDLVPQLVASGRFSIPSVTEEDHKRQKMYRDESLRRQQRQSFDDLGNYYRSLQLVLTAHRIDRSNEQRVLDLLAKTNQFNPTTRRHNRDALDRLGRQPGNLLFAYSLTDKHGSYGLIAALIGLREGASLRLDSWVMSCRAMGRTVENAIFRHLVEAARVAGIERVIGEYIPTPKNQPVASLYPTLGFASVETDAAKTYVYDMGKGLPDNDHVEIEADVAAPQ